MSGEENEASKKIPETNAIFEPWQIINQEADANPDTLRISIEAKATVKLGPFDRGGWWQNAGVYDRW